MKNKQMRTMCDSCQWIRVKWSQRSRERARTLVTHGKGIRHPNVLEKIDLSYVIPLKCVAHVGIRCQVVYAIGKDETCYAMVLITKQIWIKA